MTRRRATVLRRVLLVAVLTAGSAVLAVAWVAGPAWADNCGTPSDCFGTAGSFTRTAWGLIVLSGLSLVLDLLPGVGTVKGAVEAATGRDLLTGQQLAPWERALGVVPFVGALGAVGLVTRAGRGLDTAADVGGAARRVDGVPWSGARYADEIDPDAARAYDEIRGDAGDTARIAEHTGIPRSRLDQVKDHLFVGEHDLATGPGQTQRANFTPDADIAHLWSRAEAGTLTPQEVQRFSRLMAHEYVESSLMRGGLPYRSSDPGAWDPVLGNRPTPQHHGAHDLAPLTDVARDPFAHWPRALGREHPGISEIAADLSNLDELVERILGGGGPR